MTKESKRKAQEPPATMEYGIHLDVPGRALIAQAGERIAWHKRNVTVLTEELKSLFPFPFLLLRLRLQPRVILFDERANLLGHR